MLALLLVAVALGLSNFAAAIGIGVAGADAGTLGTYHVGLAVAAITIGAVSVTMSLLGLELGERLGTRTGGRGELIGGLVLIAVGVAVASGIL
jgi:putative Mn2+ efflux pump MntP